VTPCQRAILARLAAGPADTWELAEAAGYGRDAAGRAYVSTVVNRLRKRQGYPIHNLNGGNKRLGALYELAPGTPVCPSCGRTRLSRRNTDGICWPCQRSAVDRELAGVGA